MAVLVRSEPTSNSRGMLLAKAGIPRLGEPPHRSILPSGFCDCTEANPLSAPSAKDWLAHFAPSHANDESSCHQFSRMTAKISCGIITI